MNSRDDHTLWETVVAAERELAGCRADFYQHANSRLEILAEALNGSGWDRAAAMNFLAVLGLHDTLELLPQLVELALSHRWAGRARQAIGSARRDRLIPALEEIVLPRLGSADWDEYRRLAELLAHVEAWDILRQLTQRALTSDDLDTREVGEDFTTQYGPLWGTQVE